MKKFLSLILGLIFSVFSANATSPMSVASPEMATDRGSPPTQITMTQIIADPSPTCGLYNNSMIVPENAANPIVSAISSAGIRGPGDSSLLGITEPAHYTTAIVLSQSNMNYGKTLRLNTEQDNPDQEIGGPDIV